MRIAGYGNLPIAPQPSSAGQAPAGFDQAMADAAGENNELSLNPEKTNESNPIAKVIDNVNKEQASADQMVQKFTTGEVQDVHQVMMALEKASMAFGLTVQVRNKAIEAYQEIMRMQV